MCSSWVAGYLTAQRSVAVVTMRFRLNTGNSRAIHLMARVMPSSTSPPARAALGGDQGEEPFAVGLALHEVRHPQRGQALIEPCEATEGAVVGEQPSVLLERVGVGHGVRAGAGIPDMGQERRALQIPCLTREGVVLPGGQRLLGHVGPAFRVEGAYAGAVGLPPALVREAVRGVQKPKRGPDWFGPGVQAKQSAHATLSYSWSAIPCAPRPNLRRARSGVLGLGAARLPPRRRTEITWNRTRFAYRLQESLLTRGPD